MEARVILRGGAFLAVVVLARGGSSAAIASLLRTSRRHCVEKLLQATETVLKVGISITPLCRNRAVAGGGRVDTVGTPRHTVAAGLVPIAFQSADCAGQHQNVNSMCGSTGRQESHFRWRHEAHDSTGRAPSIVYLVSNLMNGADLVSGDSEVEKLVF